MTDAAARERQHRRYAILRDLLDLEPAAREAALVALGAEEPMLAGELRDLLGQTGAGVLDRDVAGLATELAGDDEALAPGTVIGAWRVRHALGAGGMGSVHRVDRAGDGYVQEGALKLIKRGMDSEEIVARFRRERGILSRLSHTNIARLLDGGVAADGRSYLVMEYVDGETLDAWSLRAPARAKRTELFLALCAAVAHAHHQLVVHRDIKPGNVMVTRDGEPRLLDFGIAKVLADDDAESTRTLHGPLSRAYAAPEQLGSGIVTTATDIYQLGLLLRHLFVADIANGDLAVILARATDAEPARRYATVEALAEDVRRWRDGRPILARADSAGYRLRRFVARHRVGVALAGMAVAGLLGATAVALWQAQRADREATLARSAQAFLASVFDAAAPDAEAGARVTARDLLDRGSQRIDGDLADSPRLRADLLGTFGTLYRQLGQYERADGTLARALEAWPAMDSITRQRLVIERAGIARERDHLDEADALLAPVLAAPATAALGARALVERAQVNEQRGRFEDAITDARAAAVIDATRGAAGRVDHAFDRQIEALALNRLGRSEESERAFLASINEAEGVLGGDDTRVARIRNDYAAMLGGRSRAAEAEAQARLALATRRKRLGDHHAAVAETLQILGSALRLQGRHADARAALVESLAIHRAVFGMRHAQIANTLNSLGILDASQGRMAIAAEHFGEAIEMTRALGQGDTTAAATLASNYASVLMRLGRHDEAAVLLVDARERYRQAFGEAHPAIMSNENTQAQLAVRRGRFDDAVAHARTAATIADSVLSPSREYAAIRVTLANTLLRAGQPEAALAETVVARDTLAKVDALDDLRATQADQIAADALIALGRIDAARVRVDAVESTRRNAEPALRVGALALRARLANASGDAAGAKRLRATARTLLATIESADPELARDIARD